MRLPCGHYGDEWEPANGLPGACSDPDCSGLTPDPWLISESDGEALLNRKRETREYRQAKFRKVS